MNVTTIYSYDFESCAQSDHSYMKAFLHISFVYIYLPFNLPSLANLHYRRKATYETVGTYWHYVYYAKCIATMWNTFYLYIVSKLL